jgi:hypothetical protein
MHARVSTFEGPIEDLQAELEFAKSTILPEARKLAGWQGFLDLVDPAGGRELLVTLWDTEEHLRASEERAQELRDEAAGEVGRKQVTVDRYQVLFGEVSFGI